MSLKVEDVEDQTRFRRILEIPYADLVNFILDNIGKRSGITLFFWSICFLFLVITIIVRINISGNFPLSDILLHSFLGLIVFPLLSVPIHEFMHIIPFFLSGAKKIKIGMDLRQFIFYVTAHRYVAGPLQFMYSCHCPISYYQPHYTYSCFVSSRIMEMELVPFSVFSYNDVCRRFCNVKFLLVAKK